MSNIWPLSISKWNKNGEPVYEQSENSYQDSIMDKVDRLDFTPLITSLQYPKFRNIWNPISFTEDISNARTEVALLLHILMSIQQHSNQQLTKLKLLPSIPSQYEPIETRHLLEIAYQSRISTLEKMSNMLKQSSQQLIQYHEKEKEWYSLLKGLTLKNWFIQCVNNQWIIDFSYPQAIELDTLLNKSTSTIAILIPPSLTSTRLIIPDKYIHSRLYKLYIQLVSNSSYTSSPLPNSPFIEETDLLTEFHTRLTIARNAFFDEALFHHICQNLSTIDRPFTWDQGDIVITIIPDQYYLRIGYKDANNPSHPILLYTARHQYCIKLLQIYFKHHPSHNISYDISVQIIPRLLTLCDQLIKSSM